MELKKGCAWRRVMAKGSSLTFGDNFWSNGHFLIVGEIPDRALKDGIGIFDLYERKSISTIDSMINTEEREKYSLSEIRREFNSFGESFIAIGNSWFDEDYLRALFDVLGLFDIYVGKTNNNIMAIIKIDDEIVGGIMPVKKD